MRAESYYPSFPPTHSFIRDLQVTSEVVLMRFEFHKQNHKVNNVPFVHHVTPWSIHPVRSLLALVGHQWQVPSCSFKLSLMVCLCFKACCVQVYSGWSGSCHCGRLRCVLHGILTIESLKKSISHSHSLLKSIPPGGLVFVMFVLFCFCSICGTGNL